jgi:hypothetical protein
MPTPVLLRAVSAQIDLPACLTLPACLDRPQHRRRTPTNQLRRCICPTRVRSQLSTEPSPVSPGSRCRRGGYCRISVVCLDSIRQWTRSRVRADWRIRAQSCRACCRFGETNWIARPSI